MYILGYSGFTRDARLAQGRRSPLGKTELNFDSIFEFRDGEVPFSMFPLGYFGHDASAAIIKDGKVLACASEERFSRLKFSLNLAGNTLLPRNSIKYCLEVAGIDISEVDAVAHYCAFDEEKIKHRLGLLKPFLTEADFQKTTKSYQDIYSGMMAKEVVKEQFTKMTGYVPQQFITVKHHLAHAASAFFPSGFKDALILTIDGTGEVESSLLALGKGNNITEMESTLIPTSLGALYLIITVFLGFKTLGDEYKVMGLASYGNAKRFRHVFEDIVQINKAGSYSTDILVSKDLKAFLVKNLGPARQPDESFENKHADIAAALQESLNRTILLYLKQACLDTEQNNLCLAGGVALNCSLNGTIARAGLFQNIFVQPASSDEGCSVGAAMYVYSKLADKIKPVSEAWEHVYWGPEFNDEDIWETLQEFDEKLHWIRCEDISFKIAQEISTGKVAGWFQGRMEFGPRALGNRSILADPRNPGMKDIINAKVKRRESFRPFAPAVLEEYGTEYFDMKGLSASPFMLFTVPVWKHKQCVIPAVTHVDGTARVQTVAYQTNPLFWKLIDAFNSITGVPIVLNTSFNVKNEPIVCTPKDALQCFLSTNIDCVALGEYFITKKEMK